MNLLEELQHAAIQLSLVAIKIDDEMDRRILRKAVQLMVDISSAHGGERIEARARYWN